MKKALPLAVLLLFLATAGFSQAQATQQYNRILLLPYYHDSILKNTFANFSVTINPPDAIAEVKSAIVNFQTYITSSPQDILLKVNGENCRNPSFRGTSSGFAIATFDCANVINASGKYNFSLTSTKDIGSTAGYIDLTYMNKPVGRINLMGTEYRRGDVATVFLQVIDPEQNPINTANCALDVWYPSTVNQSHPLIVQKAPMLKASGDSGIYFWDWAIPLNATLGVYMLSAKCAYATSGTFVYYLDEETQKSTRSPVIGSYVGDTIFLNDFEDWIYTSCTSGGGATKFCEADYTYNLSVHTGNQTNFTEVNLYYMGEASKTALVQLQVYNWTNNSWIALPNTVTLVGTSTVPIGIGEFVSNSLPTKDIISPSNFTIKIKTIASFGSTFTLYDNWLNIELKNSEGIVQQIKGSGEMHVNPQVNLSSLENATSSILGFVREINATTYRTERNLTNMNLTLGQVLGLAQQINLTTIENLAILSQINSTVGSNSQKLDSIIAVVNDINITVYMNKATLSQILQLSIGINSTVTNDFLLDQQIYNLLQNITVGNVTVTANVNITEIVEAILGADVEETIISSGVVRTSAPTFGNFLGGVAFADSGVTSICTTNTTLEHSITKLRCVNNVCNTIQTNSTETCQFGCNFQEVPNKCNPAPFQANLLILAVFVILMIGMGILLAKLR